MSDPFAAEAGIAVLRGNLCPDGAVIKPSAASPELLTHTGPALVFDTIEDFKARIDDPDLDVTADTVMVLRGLRPEGLPGHARGGQHAAAAQAAGGGGHRHGAHQRRPHERHRLRHHRAAHRARVHRRRTARPGAHR